MLAVTMQDVTVNSFQENDAGTANLKLNSQSRKSEVWGAGLRAYVPIGGWIPWVRVTADKERRDDLRFVTATPVTMASGNSYDVPVLHGDNTRITTPVGVYGSIRPQVGLSLSYYNVSGRSGVKEDGVSGMLSYRF